MPEEVAVAEATDESQEVESTEEETTATPVAELATLKKRLSGKDQALTAAQQARKAAEDERDALREWKAKQEKASMSELERLQAELAEARSAAEQARAEATRVSLARKFPLTFDLLGDAMPADEVRLAEIEARLKAEESDEPAPRIDPNNPRRAGGRPTPRTTDDILADLRKTAVPGADLE